MSNPEKPDFEKEAKRVWDFLHNQEMDWLFENPWNPTKVNYLANIFEQVFELGQRTHINGDDGDE